jgi:hypothetical protein
MNLFWDKIGLLGWVISLTRGLCLHRTSQHKNMWTDIHASSGIRTHCPSVWAVLDCVVTLISVIHCKPVIMSPGSTSSLGNKTLKNCRHASMCLILLWKQLIQIDDGICEFLESAWILIVCSPQVIVEKRLWRRFIFPDVCVKNALVFCEIWSKKFYLGLSPLSG